MGLGDVPIAERQGGLSVVDLYHETRLDPPKAYKAVYRPPKPRKEPDVISLAGDGTKRGLEAVPGYVRANGPEPVPEYRHYNESVEGLFRHHVCQAVPNEKFEALARAAHPVFDHAARDREIRAKLATELQARHDKLAGWEE